MVTKGNLERILGLGGTTALAMGLGFIGGAVGKRIEESTQTGELIGGVAIAITLGYAALVVDNIGKNFITSKKLTLNQVERLEYEGFAYAGLMTGMIGSYFL